MDRSQAERLEKRLELKAHIEMTSENDIERVISMQLRIGVVISIALIAIGAALLFLEGGSGPLSIGEIASSNSSINSAGFGPATVVNEVAGMQGLGFIFAGLAVLIITPVIRVALSVFFFAARGNWLYVIITAIVLIDLLVAIFIVPGFVPRVAAGQVPPG